MPKIFQIYYNNETKNLIPSEFIPYDNSNPTDSSWFEYSAIRNILLNNHFSDNQYIGIFSPKFFIKTGLNSNDVLDIISSSNSDVISFSPHLIQNACFMNAFTQGERHHPGLLYLAQSLTNKFNLNINLSTLWQDQTRIVFSNYFVAKYSFWKKWIIFAEAIFSISNENNELSEYLNSFTEHYAINDTYKYKIFIMERLISIVLESLKINAYIGLDFRKYANANPNEANLIDHALILDSLKSHFIKTKNLEFLRLYQHHLKEIINFGAVI